MSSAYPQWSGFPLPFPRSRRIRLAESEEVPDHQTQLEEILSHVRRCERWAELDDRFDRIWRRQEEG